MFCEKEMIFSLFCFPYFGVRFDFTSPSSRWQSPKLSGIRTKVFRHLSMPANSSRFETPTRLSRYAHDVRRISIPLSSNNARSIVQPLTDWRPKTQSHYQPFCSESAFALLSLPSLSIPLRSTRIRLKLIRPRPYSWSVPTQRLAIPILSNYVSLLEPEIRPPGMIPNSNFLPSTLDVCRNIYWLPIFQHDYSLVKRNGSVQKLIYRFNCILRIIGEKDFSKKKD